MYIIDSNQYTIKLVTYVSVLEEYIFESIIYMLLSEIDSIAVLSQCIVYVLTVLNVH